MQMLLENRYNFRRQVPGSRRGSVVAPPPIVAAVASPLCEHIQGISTHDDILIVGKPKIERQGRRVVQIQHHLSLPEERMRSAMNGPIANGVFPNAPWNSPDL